MKRGYATLQATFFISTSPGTTLGKRRLGCSWSSVRKMSVRDPLESTYLHRTIENICNCALRVALRILSRLMLHNRLVIITLRYIQMIWCHEFMLETIYWTYTWIFYYTSMFKVSVQWIWCLRWCLVATMVACKNESDWGWSQQVSGCSCLCHQDHPAPWDAACAPWCDVGWVDHDWQVNELDHPFQDVDSTQESRIWGLSLASSFKRRLLYPSPTSGHESFWVAGEGPFSAIRREIIACTGIIFMSSAAIHYINQIGGTLIYVTYRQRHFCCRKAHCNGFHAHFGCLRRNSLHKTTWNHYVQQMGGILLFAMISWQMVIHPATLWSCGGGDGYVLGPPLFHCPSGVLSMA